MRRSSALPVPKAKGLDKVRARVAAEQKGRWVSIRTKSGKYVRVWIGPKGHERARPEYGTGRNETPIPADVDARLDRRFRRPVERQQAGAYEVQIRRSPHYNTGTDPYRFYIQTFEPGNASAVESEAAQTIERARKLAAAQVKRAKRGW